MIEIETLTKTKGCADPPTSLNCDSDQNSGENQERWSPKEIIVHESVRTDPVTQQIIDRCPGVPVISVADGRPNTIVQASRVLSGARSVMMNTIRAGKGVVYIGPTADVVDEFAISDSRLNCPHFDRLKMASNGCFYQCEWCYLKLTYRANFPYIAVRVQYDDIKSKIKRKLDSTDEPVFFNSGELADSLALDHLTGFGREFIPFIGQTGNGHLFMLTKSDNVDDILDLDHNGRTVIGFSMNAALVSRRWETGAPGFERRLAAARKVQEAGYRLRIRLDPIVPIDGWEEAYSSTIETIFQTVEPERMTLGTLRFEEGFYRLRHALIGSRILREYVDDMIPMFPPIIVPGRKTPVVGKYSFDANTRVELFNFAISEIRKYSDCDIALCKESADVWASTGLPLSRCACVCQLSYADMTKGQEL